MMHTKIEIRYFVSNDSASLAMDGWDPNACDAADYSTERAAALYRALGASTSDEEYVLAANRKGQWALIGTTVAGHKYAVERVFTQEERERGEVVWEGLLQEGHFRIRQISDTDTILELRQDNTGLWLYDIPDDVTIEAYSRAIIDLAKR